MVVLKLLFTSFILALTTQSAICTSLKLSQIKGIRLYDDIIKSPNDKLSSYRALELANGLKILIVNDAKTKGTIVTFDVDIGYINYPKNVPGLARFLDKHVILEAATKKYPEKRQFLNFSKVNRGMIYRKVFASHATVEFRVKPYDLPETLDRFAQLFISPRFSLDMFKNSPDSVGLVERFSRIVNNHGETETYYDEGNGMYPQYHPWQYLLRSLCNKTHEFYLPLAESEGKLSEEATPKNLAALDELMKFYERYYSANRMTMLIISNQSLDDTMALVVPIFSTIPNKNVAAQSWSENPYGPGQLGYFIEVETKRWDSKFQMVFPIHGDYSSYFRSKPWMYISYILSNWGNSLFEKELRKKKLVLEHFDAKYNVLANGVTFFEISGTLTEHGLNNFEEVVEIIMQYINYIKTEKIRKWIVKEIEEELSERFKLYDNRGPIEFISTHEIALPLRYRLAMDLHDVPPKYCIFNKYMLDEYRPDLIEKFMSNLNPDNLNIFLFSKKFMGKTDRIEKWFNRRYRVKKISEDLMKKLQTKNFKSNLAMSKPNSFIPENFDIVKLDDSDKSRFPKMIHESAISRIWLLKDDFYLLPKVYLYFKLKSPLSNSSPSNSALCFMFSKMTEKALSLLTKDGELGYLQSTDTSVTKSGFTLSIEGYSDKMPSFIASVFHFITSGNFDNEYFLKLKNQPFKIKDDGYERDILLYSIAEDYSNILVSSNKWSPTEFYDSLKEITIEQMTQFREKFFSKLHIELFAYGNINREGALNVMSNAINSIQKRFALHPLLRSENQRTSIASLPEGKSFLYEMLTNQSSLSAVHVTFQATLDSIKTIALNALIYNMVDETCLFMRPSKRNSPDSFTRCESQLENGVHNIRFYAQDHEIPEILELRIKQIIKNIEENINKEPFENYEETLETMTKPFETMKNQVIKKLLAFQTSKRMTPKASHYWLEILQEQYFFNRSEVTADAIRKISIDELLTYFREILNDSSPKRRKLAIYMYSSKHKNMTTEKAGNESQKHIKITKESHFKSSLPLFELSKPNMDTPPIGTTV